MTVYPKIKHLQKYITCKFWPQPKNTFHFKLAPVKDANLFLDPGPLNVNLRLTFIIIGVFAEICRSHVTGDTGPTVVQGWANVVDAGPILKHGWLSSLVCLVVTMKTCAMPSSNL